MKIWIDVANAPHATLFTPISKELTFRGHEVVVTTWDRGQTEELASAVWPDAIRVGSGYRMGVFDKGTAVWRRALRLRQLMSVEGIDLVLGHNSYSQIVAGRLLRRHVITMMDYEHQPANHLAFRLADMVLLPEAISSRSVRRYGVRSTDILRYPGFKEEIALADFSPDPSFRSSLGLPTDRPVIVARPPAVGALYHRHENPLFEESIRRVAASGAFVLLSPRTQSQATVYARAPGIRVLERAVSGPDLLFHADVFIGGGGTMTREAAILGTPAYSVFAGKPAAVDRLLEQQGRLRFVRTVDDVPDGRLDAKKSPWCNPGPAVVRRVVDLIVGP